MQVRILFFGVLKEFAGRDTDSLSLPDESTLADVLSHYQKSMPQLRSFASSIAMSINQEYAGPESRLKAGDEVALLPPVSGGSGREVEPVSPSHSASIIHDKINTDQILEEIKRGEDGAAVVFEGIVRNHSRGRRTLYLDYEAYEEMALKQMEALAAQTLAQFEIRDVRVVHRLGRLQIGETSVLIVVASAHRAAAFDACRWLIDTLKRTVPIWKKEYFEDGAVWAAGEPFPAELSSAKLFPAKLPQASGSPAGGPASK